jgi:hypothetical protein
VDELSEDIDVAILEFVERHPDTGPRRIRQAMRLLERRSDNRRRVASALSLLGAFVGGMSLALVLG